MQHLTTPPASLESITPDLLGFISGGCHKQQCCCPAPAAPIMQQCIVQAPPQVILPQAAPPPAQPSGDSVTTSVSINGQRSA